MILLTGVDSIIESIYLGEILSEDKFKANVVVNPDNPFFKNKIIWINNPNYNLDILAELGKYNTIKSRIKINNANFTYKYIPYRSDRIRRIKLKPIIDNNCNLVYDNIENIIIFADPKGVYATILPKDFNLTSASSSLSAFELYLTLINNYLTENGNI